MIDTASTPPPSAPRRLYRSQTNRVIWGVCGGLGEYFNVDPIIFRIVFLALTFGAGMGVLLYIVLALVVPLSPETQGDGSVGGRVRGLAAELGEKGSSGRMQRRDWLGWVIVGIGVFVLLNQFFPSRFFSGGVFWSLVIIGAGFLLLTRRSRSESGQAVGSTFGPTSKPASGAAPDFTPAKDSPWGQQVHHHYHYRGGTGRLFLGLLFLIIGVAFLAQNFGWVSGVDLGALWQLWPALVIIAGLSLLSRGSWLGSLLSFLIILAVLWLVVMTIFSPGPARNTETYRFDTPREAGAKRANVSLQLGAVRLTIASSTTSLAAGALTSNVAHLETHSEVRSGVQYFTLTAPAEVRNVFGRLTNTLDLNLSRDLPVDLSIDAGASKLTLDLTQMTAENVNISSGASSINLDFGDRAISAAAVINAGASNIRIRVPQALGVRATVQGGLVSKSFPGFADLGNSVYETDQYASSTHKLQIIFSGGVSSITVERR